MDDLKDLKFIQEKSSFSKAYIYRQIALGKLAKPIKIGRASRWKLADVEQWLKAMTDGERTLSDVANLTQARVGQA